MPIICHSEERFCTVIYRDIIASPHNTDQFKLSFLS